MISDLIMHVEQSCRPNSGANLEKMTQKEATLKRAKILQILQCLTSELPKIHRLFVKLYMAKRISGKLVRERLEQLETAAKAPKTKLSDKDEFQKSVEKPKIEAPRRVPVRQ